MARRLTGRCEDVEALISADVDGEDLSTAERELLELHMRECAFCRSWETDEAGRAEFLRAELRGCDGRRRVLARAIVDRACRSLDGVAGSGRRRVVVRVAAAFLLLAGGAAILTARWSTRSPDREANTTARAFVMRNPSEIRCVGEVSGAALLPGFDGNPVERCDLSDKLILLQRLEAFEWEEPGTAATPVHDPQGGEVLLELEHIRTDYRAVSGWPYH